MIVAAGTAHGLTLGVFAVILAMTLAITYWASRRTRDATSFWAADRGITGAQNGLAIAGDYMSAAAFLGTVGLIYLFGFDGFITGVAALASFVTVLLLLAERMRNAGQFTMADVLAFRLNAKPARSAAAIGTLVVVGFYLIAQMIAAGALFEALAGITFPVAVVLTGAFMLVYVLFGGMIATTWVQIVKAVLLMTGVVVLTVLVLRRVSWNPFEVMARAPAHSDAGDAFLAPGQFFKKPLDSVSTALAFLLGTAGLPHILMRFFTVPDGRAARRSVGWAVAVIGTFYILVSIIGFGARDILATAGEKAAGKGGNLAAPLLAQNLGGGAGTFGGDVLLAIISAIAFATILAVVAGLVIAASGAVAHDVYTHVVRGGDTDEGAEVRVARVAAAAIAIVAMALAILAGKGFNIQFLVSLTFAVAASANFPPLLLALTWRRFNTTGALAGVAVGLVSAIGLIILSPTVWPGPDSEGGPFPIVNPAIVSIPLGFLACWIGTLLGPPEEVDRYTELRVRADTGFGAERARTPTAGSR
jgi:cation/acetate symporter